MSFWVHAFCNDSVHDVSPNALREGIAQRLKSLTYLFCPEDEEDPAKVLQRLEIEDQAADDPFGVFRMRYRTDDESFIRIERSDRAGVDELDRELQARNDTRLADIRRRLSAVTEDVSFCLKAADVRGMGFPLAIAGAAYLVERAGGLIQSGHYSWMEPAGSDVRIIFEVKR